MLNTFWMSSRWTLISFLFGIIAVNTLIPDVKWGSELFHVLIEGGGSLIGFGLAFIVFAMIKKQQLTANYIWLIPCFISMGTLDMFHSQVHPGQVFVWLHSAATFIGGLFAMLIWLPKSLSIKFFKSIYFWIILILSVGFSVASILWPEMMPLMLDKNKQFTFAASLFNIIGGIGFLVAWFYFAKEYHESHYSQSFYFSNHFSLFGIAGLLFEFSVLWDGNWWFWHMMRAFAYVLLMFHFSSVYRRTLLTKIEQATEIFEQTLNEIYMFDKNTLCFSDVNLGARNNIGYSLAELKRMTPVDIGPEMTKEKLDKIVSPLLSGAKNSLVFNTSIQRKDGSCYPAEINLQLSHKEPCVFFAFVVDITERIAKEGERSRLQNELLQSQKMDSLGQLTGGIAHDFNNLLGVINGYSLLIIKKYAGKVDENLLVYMDNIIKAGDRAANLVTQMLSFSRREVERSEPLDLSSFIQEDVKLVRSSLPSTIEIDIEVEPGLPHVLVDQNKLHQIIMNLSVNARDAMAGVGKLTIRIYEDTALNTIASVSHKPVKGSWVVLSINDTGSGIDPEIIKDIFNPFFTTKDVGKGTGLGLSVVYRIIENYGGHILLDSEPGKGTTFRILFSPVIQETVIRPEPIEESADIPNGNGSEILVVDDELMLAEHMSELLKGYNYKPHYVVDSAEALDLFQKEPERFSLLITDQTMPKISGIELIDKLRKVRKGLPAIICSGFSDKIDAHRAAEFDVFYLSKPVDTNKLLRKIAELIGLNYARE